MERDGLNDLLKAKERGDEAQYFRRHDEELLRRLRERAKLDEMTQALRTKLHIDDPALLQQVVAQGVSLETGPAFLLAPLVQIAWAEGTVSKEERDLILLIARERGIDEGSPSYARLLEWLARKPTELLFETSEACLKHGLALLPPIERDARIAEMVTLCRRVAEASGGTKLGRFLGVTHGVVQKEEVVLAAITARLTL